MLGDALSAVHEAIREREIETGLAHPASAGRFRTPTGNSGIQEILSASQSCSLTAASACQGPPSWFSTYCTDATAGQSQDALEIAVVVAPGLALSEHNPCLVGGTVTLGDASFTAKIAAHSGGDAIVPYRCAALLDTGSPQTFIRRDVLGHMRLVGAASAACERPWSPRSLGGFGESPPSRTSTSIRLSVQFFRDNEPTFFLAVWTCVVPPSVLQHAVVLGRDSRMRFNTRWYRALPPRPHHHQVLGELTLSHHATTGVWTYAMDPTAMDGGFHLVYDGTVGVTLSNEPQLLEVNLVRSNGSPARTGHYLVAMRPQRSTRKGVGVFFIWRPAASFGFSNAFAVTFGEPSSGYSPSTRHWKA